MARSPRTLSPSAGGGSILLFMLLSFSGYCDATSAPRDKLGNTDQSAGIVSVPLTKTYNLKASDGTVDVNVFYSEVYSHFANNSAGGPMTFPHTLGLDIELDDYGYLATFQIGTPPRDFRFLVDSGSTHLWVGGEGCVSDNGTSCGPHRLLGPRSSSTFKDTGKNWKVVYGSGPIVGHIVTDDVSVAGLMLKNHHFSVAYYEAQHYAKNETMYDGILGLARSTAYLGQLPTIPEALYSSGLIKFPVVSYKIPRAADNKHDGELTFGGMNPARYDPKTVVTLKNISPERFWEIPLDGAEINGVKMKWGRRGGILDSGTTFIMAPRRDAATIHTAIPGARYDDGGWMIPCNTRVPFSLTIGKRKFDVQPRDLVFIPLNTSLPNGECMSRIGELHGSPQGARWIVGDVFLKNVYFSTDLEKNEISIAKLAE